MLTLRGVKHKSKTISKSLNPLWDETCSFEGSLGELTDQPMLLEVWYCIAPHRIALQYCKLLICYRYRYRSCYCISLHCTALH